MKFTYILNNKHNPRYNLALEEALFLKAVKNREGYLMLWINDPTVVIGRYQNTAEEVSREYISTHKVNVVRRITGGGAVYHDRGNLNYTVILPTQDEEVLNIQAFGIPLVEHLKSLGVTAQRTGRNDVTVNGRKFSGVAQYSADGVILHHGTLLYNSKLEDVSQALRVKTEKFQSKGFKSVRSRVTNLLPCLPRPMSMEDFRSGFAEALIRFYYAEEVRPPSDEEEAAARKLKTDKYDTRQWTWEESPRFTYTSERRFNGGTVQIGLAVEKGHVKDCRIYGDYFSSSGTAEVEKILCGQPYPFENLDLLLRDELLKKAFSGISPEDIRAFLQE